MNSLCIQDSREAAVALYVNSSAYAKNADSDGNTSSKINGEISLRINKALRLFSALGRQGRCPDSDLCIFTVRVFEACALYARQAERFSELRRYDVSRPGKASWKGVAGQRLTTTCTST
jgi:hypothetical protein